MTDDKPKPAEPVPREWWILPDGQTLEFEPRHFRSVHVVEFAAYAKLEARCAELENLVNNLREDRDDWANKAGPNSEYWRTENASLRAALERIAAEVRSCSVQEIIHDALAGAK